MHFSIIFALATTQPYYESYTVRLSFDKQAQRCGKRSCQTNAHNSSRRDLALLQTRTQVHISIAPSALRPPHAALPHQVAVDVHLLLLIYFLEL